MNQSLITIFHLNQSLITIFPMNQSQITIFPMNQSLITILLINQSLLLLWTRYDLALSKMLSFFLPRSSSAGLLGSPFVPPGVVLSDSPLGVHSEADVNSPLKLRVGTIQHVNPIKALHLHNHYNTPTCAAQRPAGWKTSLVSIAARHHLDKLHNRILILLIWAFTSFEPVL